MSTTFFVIQFSVVVKQNRTRKYWLWSFGV